MAKKIIIKQKDGEPEIPVEILAASVVEIAAGMKKLRTSRMQDSVLEHLISWKSGVSVYDVRKILETLEGLEGLLLKKKQK